jgi:hypothetical protein
MRYPPRLAGDISINQWLSRYQLAAAVVAAATAAVIAAAKAEAIPATAATNDEDQDNNPAAAAAAKAKTRVTHLWVPPFHGCSPVYVNVWN